MSLNYDLTRVRDREEVSEHKRLKAVADALIRSTISVGIGEITEKNADRFYGRLRLAELVYGAFLDENHGTEENPDWRPVYISREEVRRFIGLRTNVFPMKPDSKFLEQLQLSLIEDAQKEG